MASEDDDASWAQSFIVTTLLMSLASFKFEHSEVVSIKIASVKLTSSPNFPLRVPIFMAHMEADLKGSALERVGGWVVRLELEASSPKNISGGRGGADKD